MPRWKLRIEERAESEARSAFLWYLARNARAAERFQAAVEECIGAIAEAPERFPETEPGIRRRLVFTTPHGGTGLPARREKTQQDLRARPEG